MAQEEVEVEKCSIPEVARPLGEYLAEPPDQNTVTCNGAIRYDQLSADDGVEKLRAMGAAAYQLSDDLDLKAAAKAEAEAKFGLHLALNVLPGIEYYRHQYQIHKDKGERDFRIAGCSGIEALEKKVGIQPVKVRVWRTRYGHLPQLRAALQAMGVPVEEKPKPTQKCEHCGTKINLPEGEEPDHDETCPHHEMRRKPLDVVKNAAVRALTYEQLVSGTGKYKTLKPEERTVKMHALAQGCPVSTALIDAGDEIDEFTGLLNRIRGRDVADAAPIIREFFDCYIEQLSVIGFDLADCLKPKPSEPEIVEDAYSEAHDPADAESAETTALLETELAIAPDLGEEVQPEPEPAQADTSATRKQRAARMLAWVKENPTHGLSRKQLGDQFGMTEALVGRYLRKK
jgi:hypothetical protein